MMEQLTVPFDRGNDKQITELFQEHGAVLIRDVVPQEVLATFRETIKRMIRARLDSIGTVATTQTDLDALYNQLCSIDRKLGSNIYDHVKDLPEYYQLISHPNLLAVARTLLGTRSIQMPFDLCLFRIDRPTEDRFTFDWHQDYPYNLMSLAAVTAWIPLTDVSEAMGRLRVVPGSHKRIHPIRITQTTFRPGQGGGGRALALENPNTDAFERQALAVPARAGDILFFHALTLHRSSPNRSQHSRWTVNPRYGSFLDADLVKRGWRNVTRQDFFLIREVHPELVTVGE